MKTLRDLAKEIEQEMYDLSNTDTTGFRYEELETLRHKYDGADIRLNAVRKQIEIAYMNKELDGLENEELEEEVVEEVVE